MQFKKTLFVLIATALSLVAQAQVISIATARARDTGTVVTVSGIVTNGSELGNIRYIQDRTGGIAAFGAFATDTIKRGDSITVTGKLLLFRNLLEISPVTSVQLIARNKPLPAPKVLLFAQIVDSLEGQLVTYKNVNFSVTGSFAAATNYDVNVGATKTQARSGPATSSLIGRLIPTSTVDVVGILSQFCTTPITGCTTGYQTLLRDTADIIFNSISITAPLTATNLTTTSFTANWQTNVAGTTVLNYGLTPALGQTATIAGTRSAHAVPLMGLTAATIYYVQGVSVANGVEIKTPITPIITASTSTGEIRVYFNHSVDTTVRVPDAKPLATTGSRCESELISRIASATTTIDVAMYSASSLSIRDALKQAAARGVRVRYIADKSAFNTIFTDTASLGFKFIKSTNTDLMHNKFFIFDVADANRVWISTGAMNNSVGQIYNDYNNMIMFQDQALARVYTVEFEEMWGSTTNLPNVSLGKYGPNKTDNTPHTVVMGNGEIVNVYFSPSDRTSSAIIKEIDNAISYVDFALLIFTYNDLGTAIYNAKRRGVQTRGIIDKDTATTGGEYGFLTRNGVPIHLYNSSSIFHHKYCIIDGKAPNLHPTIITGSHNWSSAAETKNDENTVILHDLNVVNIYLQEFEARWKESTPVDIKEVGGNIQGFEAVMSPNPANDNINIQLKNDINRNITFTIWNTVGQPIESRVLAPFIGETTQNISLNHLPSGQYIVTFKVDGKILSKMIQVIH